LGLWPEAGGGTAAHLDDYRPAGCSPDFPVRDGSLRLFQDSRGSGALYRCGVQDEPPHIIDYLGQRVCVEHQSGRVWLCRVFAFAGGDVLKNRLRVRWLSVVAALVAMTLVVVLLGSCDWIVFENPFVHPSEGTPGVLGDWTEVTADAPVFPRLNFGTTVFDGQIWIVSGVDDTGTVYNDIWSSPDGATWTQVFSDTFLANTNPGFTAFGGQLFYYDSAGEMHYSSDGVAWTNAGLQPMAPEKLRLVVTEGDTMWAVLTTTGAVWRTENPMDPGGWSFEDDGSAFPGDPGNEDLAIAAYNDELWIVARSLGVPDGIWRFNQSSGWKEMGSASEYNRSWTQIIGFEESIWLISGLDSSIDDPMVISRVHRINPENGDHKRIRPDPPWAARQRFGSVVFKDRIYIFGGGEDEFLNPRRDVWYTSYEHFWD
jgi:hypothetical protein